MRLVNTFLLFSAVAVLAISSCVSGQSITSKNQEIIEYFVEQYSSTDTSLSHPFWSMREKVWIKGNLAIEEVRYIKTEKKVYENSITTFPILLYRFSDLENGYAYEYKSFSDTGTLIRNFFYHDSILVVGGWNFNFKRDYGGATERLSDTTIDNIGYKRTRVNKITGGIPYVIYCYFRCDKQGTIFDIDPDVSKTIGCPLVKAYMFPPGKKGLRMINEVIFLSDTLSADELKVFDTWEKYAKKNPPKN